MAQILMNLYKKINRPKSAFTSFKDINLTNSNNFFVRTFVRNLKI